jgi:hypothetical protein
LAIRCEIETQGRRPIARGETPTARRVNWRFTTVDAQIKLEHLYPTHQS